MEFVFSPDVILCGWLGSKHQLTNSFISLIYSLTARVVGAPQMISQPVSSIFPVLHRPLGLGKLRACPFPDVVFPSLPLSALSPFPLSLCLARWFWLDLMNGRHDHTTAVCVSLLCHCIICQVKHVNLIPSWLLWTWNSSVIAEGRVWGGWMRKTIPETEKEGENSAITTFDNLLPNVEASSTNCF